MDQPQELVFLTQAQRMLAQAQSVDDVKDLLNKAEAVKVYAKKARLGHHLVIEASTIKLQAERKLGQFLKSLPLAKAARGNQHTGTIEEPPSDGAVFLRDLGMTKAESFRAQRIASLPEEVFQRYLSETARRKKEPTVAGLLRLAGKTQRNGVTPTPQIVSSLHELVDQGAKFATIYADPPWPYDNQASRGAAIRHYQTSSVEDICAEPVAQLTQEQAHLHLWTTNGFLQEAFRVMKAWGFAYKSCFVWTKPQLGVGNYWRVSHEFLLLGVKGNLPFRDRSQQSWISCERTEHSRKPHAVRRLIERVSPFPYLELYARDQPPNFAWAVFGNEVPAEKTLFDEPADAALAPSSDEERKVDHEQGGP